MTTNLKTKNKKKKKKERKRKITDQRVLELLATVFT
jgi:hypothetical protein